MTYSSIIWITASINICPGIDPMHFEFKNWITMRLISIILIQMSTFTTGNCCNNSISQIFPPDVCINQNGIPIGIYEKTTFISPKHLEAILTTQSRNCYQNDSRDTSQTRLSKAIIQPVTETIGLLSNVLQSQNQPCRGSILYIAWTLE